MVFDVRMVKYIAKTVDNGNVTAIRLCAKQRQWL